MKPVTFIRWCIALLAGPLVACHAPTSPSGIITNPTPDQIVAQRAVWASHGLTDYSYTYEFFAFNAVAFQPIRLGVRQDTVRSAVLIATGRALVPVPTYFPTIDKLFDLALEVATAGSLRVIAFDPALRYPVHMEITAPPDALSGVEASALQPF